MNDETPPQEQTEPLQENQQQLPSLEPQLQPPLAVGGSKKSNKKLFLWLAVAVFLLLVVAGCLYFFLVYRPGSMQNNELMAKQDSHSHSQSNASLEALSTSLEKALESPVISTAQADERAGITFNPGNTPYYVNPVAGSDILTVSQEATSLDAITIQKQAVITVLRENGMSEHASGEESEFYQATWGSDKTMCEVFSALNQDTSVYELALNCAATADFESNSKAMKPYYEAYAKNRNREEAAMVVAMNFSKPTGDKASKTAGYSLVAIPLFPHLGYVGGFVGEFYRTPDGTIHYFRGAQAPADCSDYSTDDLKKAYLGEQCYDPKVKSTDGMGVVSL